jgi:uridine kinase
VLLDGLWLLRDADMRGLYSLSVFVECPEEVRLARRLERDQRERGRSAESVRAQLQGHVAPMHRRFVAPQAQHADLVIQSTRGTATLSELRAVLSRLLQNGHPLK